MTRPPDFSTAPPDRPATGTVPGAPPLPGGLTHAQRLLWTGQQLRPDVPLYNMALAFTWRGALDVPLFRAAFDDLIRSSDSLRSRVAGTASDPRLEVSDQVPRALEVIDRSDDSEMAFEAWCEDRAKQPLSWTQWLYDAALVRRGDDHHVWFFNQHHLIADAWSAGVCFDRLEAFYRHRRGGPSVAEAPTFAAYRTHEAAQSSKPSHREAARHWRNGVSAPPRTPLVGDEPARRDARTSRVRCPLGAERSQRLRALATSATFRAITADLACYQLFATALAAFLFRVGGRKQPSFLVPMHNRTTAAFRETIGLFIELFPLSLSVEEGETFTSLFRRVRTASQQVLAKGLPGTSHAGHAASHDVLLNYIHRTFRDFDGHPTHATWIHPEAGDPAHSLRLQVHDFAGNGEFQLDFDLHCDVFAPAERDAVVQRFLTLLDAMLEDPGQPLHAPALCPPAEAARLTAEMDRTDEPPARGTVYDAWRRTTEATPQAIAVMCGETSWTYEQLDAESATVADSLVARGVGPGSTVALCMERSPAFVAAVWGVLRTGAAYLPLDPSHPAERLDAIVRHADLVWTTAPRPFPVPSIAPSDATPTAPTTPANPRRDHAPDPTNPAYIIFTSGSTGTPKGVVVSHGALLHYISWAAHHYRGDDSISCALHSSVSVDLTVSSLFLPLVTGGTLVVYPEDPQGPDLSILRAVDDDAVDLLKVTPSHLRLLRHHEARPRRLRVLVVGGEELPTELARATLDRWGEDVALYNEYGPTEATVGCMVHRYDPRTDLAHSVPIGRPITRTAIDVLDSQGRPVPVGLSGELFIAGAGLADGYLATAGSESSTTLDADRTAERFVHDAKGRRHYRTGDLARRGRDGTLMYLGRADRQVKVRGTRIELAEVEAALQEHPHVAACVVDAVTERSAPRLASGTSRVTHCRRCGLASNHPEAKLDDDQVCRICYEYEGYRDRAQAYFRTEDDLRTLFDDARSRNPDAAYDCLMMLSGGKDSTYALYQLVEMGLRVLVFSLDNGFISDSAKANIRRAVDDLGVEIVWGKTPAMNAIFAESLQQFSNVCQGCFKTIYTLGMNLARERGIRHLVTGLSRGQIFETRLAGFYRVGIDDPDRIDQMIVDARRAYHRLDDAVSRRLDVSLFEDDETFEQIRIVDFYRYTNVRLETMYDFLDRRAPWTRPEDTGRSTNCLINETGIHIHKRERGFHNYALPYSWDVRLGHKTRDECLEELDDEIDLQRVERTLREVGYTEGGTTAAETRLVGYVVPAAGSPPPTSDALRNHLASRLPDSMVPATFVLLDALPLTASGKLDQAALRAAEASSASTPGAADSNDHAPDDVVADLIDLWQRTLGRQGIAPHDHFLELGGDSIDVIRLVSLAADVGLRIEPRQVFEHPTVKQLARAVVRTNSNAPRGAPSTETGPVPLTPIQHWFFAQGFKHPELWNQSVVVQTSDVMDVDALRHALASVQRRHDALRLRFTKSDAGWRASIAPVDNAPPTLHDLDLRPLSADQRTSRMNALENELHLSFDLARGPRVRVMACREDDGTTLTVIAHHLAIDAVSWPILLDDLLAAYDAHCNGGDPSFASHATSWRAWALALNDVASTSPQDVRDARPTSPTPSGPTLPRLGAGPTHVSHEQGVVGRLTKEETQELQATARQRGVAVRELLLAALARSLQSWAKAPRVAVDVEEHGRHDTSLDASKTVGWCACLRHLVVDTEEGAAVEEALASVQRGLQDRRGATRATFEARHPSASADVLFNDLGQGTRNVSRLTWRRSLQLHRSPDERRTHLLAVHTWVQQGVQEIHWAYSTQAHDADTVQTLNDQMLAELRSLTASAPAPEVAADVDLSESELDDLLDEFGDPE